MKPEILNISSNKISRCKLRSYKMKMISYAIFVLATMLNFFPILPPMLTKFFPASHLTTAQPKPENSSHNTY